MPELIADTALPQFPDPSVIHFVEDQSGQDVIEYALVAAMVAFGSVSGTANVGGKIADTFTNVSNSLDTAASAGSPSTPSTSTPPAPTPPSGNSRRGGRNGGPGGGGGRRHRFF